MRYARYYLPLLLLALLWISVRPLLEDRSLGSKTNPIMVLLTPSVDADRVSKNADVLVRYLETHTGYHYKAVVPTNFVAVVEAFGSGKADIAIMNTFSYLLAHSRYGANAVMKVVRRDGELNYRGQIIARTDSGIDTLTDLSGKRIAYVDPSSTSGYIYPKALLQKAGIRTKEEVFGNKHDVVVMMVYQRQVDAGATFYSPPDKRTGEILDARAKVHAQFPDVYDKVKIIALTDAIPNDPVVVRKDFPVDMQQRIIAALTTFQGTKEGKAALKDIASVEGLAASSDADYNDIRALISRYSVDIEKVLKKK